MKNRINFVSDSRFNEINLNSIPFCLVAKDLATTKPKFKQFLLFHLHLLHPLQPLAQQMQVIVNSNRGRLQHRGLIKQDTVTTLHQAQLKLEILLVNTRFSYLVNADGLALRQIEQMQPVLMHKQHQVSSVRTNIIHDRKRKLTIFHYSCLVAINNIDYSVLSGSM